MLELRLAVDQEDCSIISPVKPLLLPYLTGACTSHGVRWITMRKRRANILAIARRLIAEESYGRVGMRRIADLSEVTIPTIYNLIGGREEVLQIAIREALNAKIIYAKGLAKAKNINPTLALADTIWKCLADYPDYSRQLVLAIAHEKRDGRLRKNVEAQIRAFVKGALDPLSAGGRFQRTGVSTQTMAEFISHQILAAVASWAEDRTETNELRCKLAQGTGLLLLGSVGEEEAVKVSRWLNVVLTDLATC
jgi:AcrR family transcriptional regulator